MLITVDVVLATLRSTLGRPVQVDPDVPLVEADVQVDSLTMLSLLSQLERRAGLEVPEHDLIRLSAGSVNDIAAWFARHAGAEGGGAREGGAAACYHEVPGAVDLAEGRTRAVVVENRSIVIAKHGGRLYAVENRCPHQGQELVGALLRRGQLICPHHGARFDLETGASTGPHTDCPIAVFERRVVDGRLEILVPASSGAPRRSDEAGGPR